MVYRECTVRNFLEDKCGCTVEEVLRNNCKNIITEDLPFIDELNLAKKYTFFKENKMTLYNFLIVSFLSGLFILFSYDSIIVCNLVLSYWSIIVYAILSYQFIKYHKFIITITFGVIALIAGLWIFNKQHIFENIELFSFVNTSEQLQFKLNWYFLFDFAWIMMTMFMIYFIMEYMIEKVHKRYYKMKELDMSMMMQKPPQDDIYSLKRNRDTRKTILYFGYIILLAYCEEFIFRFSLNELLLYCSANQFLSTIIVSFIFGLAHLPNGGISYAFISFILGLFLMYVYLKWGIFGAFIIHAVWNFL